MRRPLAALSAVALAVLGPITLVGQSPPCTPPKNSNVAKLLAWFASPLAFSQPGPIERMPAGAVKIGGDLTYVPAPAAAITRTDFCYRAKSEHTGLSPVFPRPRLVLGLGAGFSAEAMYLPPVTVAEATPNMGSVALAWASPAIESMNGIQFTARAHATFGHVKGPITCPRGEIQQTDPLGSCWARKPSEDSYSPNVRGAEASAGSSRGRVRWYGGAGYSSLMPRFQVGYRAYNGTLDSTRVRVDLTRVTAFAGLAYAATRTLQLSAQLYSVPEDATTGRVGFLWRLR
ncbi:MAG TPA: hypothetical protein VHE78_04735 [Gemmatimonadaceae bacterium]|nr:hypothetical protein [Gemmatimonadaceae bacterium]